MKISSKGIVKKIKDEQKATKRRRVSLYINAKTVDAFMRVCEREGLSASIVVEKMMSEFIGSSKE